MNAESGTESWLRQFGRWSPENIYEILDLEYHGERTDAPSWILLTCRVTHRKREVAWPPIDDRLGLITEIRFENIVDFRIRGTLPLRVLGFYVDDVRERRMEGLNYNVGDYENSESIQFSCQTFEIVQLRATGAGGDDTNGT